MEGCLLKNAVKR